MKKNNKTRLVSAVLLLLTLITMSLSLTACQESRRVDYLNDDLSKYVKIEESDYKGYEIEISIPEITDVEIEAEILRVLSSNRGELLYEGHYRRDKAINVGDIAYIWYRGYEIDEAGNQKELSGTSNFSESASTPLTIGSGQFIPGFEAALIGMVPKEHSTGDFEVVTTGKPTAGDIVYMQATYVAEEDGNLYSEMLRIDLNDPDIEKKWGVGIRDFICGCMIGVTAAIETDPWVLVRAESGEHISYLYTKVEYVTKSESTPITIKTVFPYDYSEEKFQNKTVYFDVYIDETLCYTPAVLDDAFITETLEISAEKLEPYEGTTLTEKYRSFIKEGLASDRNTERQYAAEDAMWEHLKKNVEVKKLPGIEVRMVYNDYLANFEMDYAQNYTSYYESLDAYIRDYYGLDEGGDWKAKLTEQVENEITEKLIFYSIMRRENLVPEGELFNQVYKEELERDFEYYGKTRADFESEEKYQEALAAYEAEMLEYYSKEFYIETVYYNYASRKMLEFATIKNVI